MLVICNQLGLCVVTLNAGKRWGEWLEALHAQTIQPGTALVVDSSSDDDTRALAFNRGLDVYQINRKDFDHGATRQLAVELMGNIKFLVFLTQDAFLAEPESLSNLLAPFDDPQVGALFGRQLPRESANHIEAHARLFNYPDKSKIYTIDDARKGAGLKAAFMSNSFAAYRKEALLSVGGFPSNTILCEDVYVAAKMLLSGWKIAYNAEAKVFHSHNYSMSEEFKRYFDIGVFHAREPWIRRDIGRAEGEGKRFVISEMHYLFKKKRWMIPEAILRTFVKLIAYRLGMLEKLIPRELKKRISMHKKFWDKSK